MSTHRHHRLARTVAGAVVVAALAAPAADARPAPEDAFRPVVSDSSLVVTDQTNAPTPPVVQAATVQPAAITATVDDGFDWGAAAIGAGAAAAALLLIVAAVTALPHGQRPLH
jgi:hypothetical protein